MTQKQTERPAMTGPVPIRRTTEIEEITNLYLIHPLASRLVPFFARMRFTPNAVSVTGMLFGILSAFAYFRYSDVRFAITGFALMIAWHVMDGADGQLARLTQTYSYFGKVLDGISDNVTFLAVYTALAISLSHEYGDWMYALVALSAVCHAIQSASYEVQRQEYNFWGRGQKSAELVESNALPQDNSAASLPQRLQNLLYRLYTRGQFLAAGATAESHKKLAAALELHPGHAASIRQRYCDVFAPSVRRWSVLSSNYRTLGIFICALLQAPLYYFAFEIFGFSLILIVLLARQRARYERFFKTLATME